MICMYQIIYEIVLSLNKKPQHLSALARTFKQNAMTLRRRLKELEERNVLDHERQGKNDIYMVKRTLEADTYLKIAEHERFIRTIQDPTLRELAQTIAQDERIKLAILFGSRARGDHTPDSDIDLYINTKKVKDEYEKRFSGLAVKTGEFSRKSPLIREIIKHHVILKGVDEYFAKSKTATSER